MKRQAEGGVVPLYQLVNLNGEQSSGDLGFQLGFSGGGYLYELMKKCSQIRNFKELDEALELKMKPFLYNEGEGKKVPIAQLIFMRNLDRFKHNQLQELKDLGKTFSLIGH